MKDPFPTDWKRILFFGIGAGVMAAFTFLRYQLSWWPIHPIGFPLAGADCLATLAMPVFIAWMGKYALMKLGGVALYRRAKPFFLGLLIGYVSGVTASFLVDMIWFPGQGHMVHWW